MSMHALMMERLTEITSYVWHFILTDDSPDQNYWDRFDSAAWVDGLAVRTRGTEDRISGSGMMSRKDGRKE